jgi:hypothetical protein
MQMHRTAVGPIVAAAFLQCAPLAAAAVPTAISPVFHQLVLFSLPAGFKAAFEKTNGSFYIREHIPEGESVDKWTRMITLTAAKDLASNPDATPQALLGRMAAGFRTHCPDTFTSAVLGPQTVDGHAGFEMIASCGHVPAGGGAYSETAIMLAIKGSSDYYTLQWAERGPDSPRPLNLDNNYWTRQLELLRPIRLCPIVPGEAPPYPSCVGR